MWRKALVVAALVFFSPVTECRRKKDDSKKSTSCRRTNQMAFRYCTKPCQVDKDCKENQKCLCDGDCGMSCVRNNVRCKVLPRQEHLRQKFSNGRYFDSVVTHACPRPYKLRGSSKRTCRAIGEWDGKRARCKKYCKDPGEIEHGNRNVNGLQVGKYIRYWCFPSYNMEGASKITCEDQRTGDPVWSADKPVCKVPTCPPPVIPETAYAIGFRGNMPKTFRFDEVVQLKCRDGYFKSGLGILRCKGPTWTEGIRCTPKSCGRPNEILKGRIIGYLYSFKQMVRYACDDGYQLSGPDFRQCQANEKWSGKDPTCEVVNCGHLKKPDHGDIIEQVDFTFGNRVVFECTEKGYEMKGTKVRICQSDGSWSGSTTTCELVSCGNPGTPLNGKQIVNKGFVYGGSVRFECDRNYTLTKRTPEIIYCQADKKWSALIPSCLAPCSDPGVPYNGARIGHDFRHDSTVRFTCRPNHVMEGISEISCSNGKWSHRVPTCKAPCNKPAGPAKGWSRGGFRHGSSMTFRCYQGYQRIGAESITCNDGTWTNDPPVCKGVCGNPGTPFNGRLYGKSFLDGDEVHFSCDRNYDLFGSQRMLCVDRAWNSRLPECKARCVITRRPDNGFYQKESGTRGNVVKHGERITYGCLEGFSLIGVARQDCDNGVWTNDKPACKADCLPPSDINHGNKTGYSYRHGERVQYECDFGYTLDGEQNLACVDGTWNFDPPKCRASCPRPEWPKNGWMEGDNFGHNKKVEFSCHDNYQLEGEFQITCNDGFWSAAFPTCIAACPHPGLGAPAHGRRLSDDFRDGKIVRFVCNKGYELFGSKTIQCKGGAWNASTPECKASCKFTGDPDKGYTLNQALQGGRPLKHGSTVEFGCEASYTLIGSKTVHCVDGGWNASMPLCKAPCGDPGFIAHGKRTGKDFSHGQNVTYECNEGYSLQGNHQVTCNDGNWHPDQPQCKATCPGLQLPSNSKVNSNETEHGAYVSFSCDEGFYLEGSKQLKCVDGHWTNNTPTCKACGGPLGMENSGIEDFRITSPSWRSQAKYARLHGQFAWCPRWKTYLQIELGTRYKLTAIATQGRQGRISVNAGWVRRYRISFLVGKKEVVYVESGLQQVIDGNQDSSSVVKYFFKEPFVTKIIRIHPDFDSSPICLRTELYGCQPKPDCIHVGSLVWGLWTHRNYSFNYYLAYITKLNTTHVDFALEYNNGQTRSYNRTDPVLVINKIPEMKDISVDSRVIAVHKPKKPEWYRAGNVTVISGSSSVSVKFDNRQTRGNIPLRQLRLVRRPRFCTNF